MGRKKKIESEIYDQINIMALIDAIYKRTEIWDTSNPFFNNIHNKHRYAWPAVATALDLEPSLEIIETLKRKWRNLRTNYQRYLQLAKTVKSCSSGNENISWPYFNAMSFLKSTLKSNVEDVSNTLSDNENSSHKISNATVSNTTEKDFESPIPSTSVQDFGYNSSVNTPPPLKKPRRNIQELRKKQIKLTKRVIDNDEKELEILKERMNVLKQHNSDKLTSDEKLLQDLLNLCLPIFSKLNGEDKNEYFQEILKLTGDFYKRKSEEKK